MDMVDDDRAVCILNGLCRARGHSGEDLVTKSRLPFLSRNPIMGEMVRAVIVEPHKLLYETDYVFL
jgi:hypothetical protein